MIISVPSVLPGGTLTPAEVQKRFNARSLAGLYGLGFGALGQACCDGSMPDQNEDGSETCEDGSTPGCPSQAVVQPVAQPSSVSTPASAAAAAAQPADACDSGYLYDANSGVCVGCDPGYSLNISTGVCTSIPTVAATSGLSCGSGTVNVNGKCVVYPTGNNATDQAVAAAVAAGLSLAKLAVIQPGTTMLANGTIARSSTGAAPLLGSTAASMSSSTMILLVVALGAAALLMGSGRGGN